MLKNKLNILFLTARFPFPVIGGDRLKPYNLISHLAKHHNVTLVSFFHGSAIPEDYKKAIHSLGVDLHIIPLSSLTAGVNATKKLFKFPLEIGFYYSKEYKQIVDDLIKNQKFDISFAFFMRTAEYLKNHDIKKILIAEDCRTLYQKRSYETSNNFIQKNVRLWEFKRLCKYEPEIVKHFNATTLVSNQDIEAMKKQNPTTKYFLLTNGTDIDYFKPDNTIDRKDILFAGKIDVWANQLMIKKIVNDILPEIHKVVPDTKLNIVGANPPKSVLDLKSEKINVIGNVPEMLPYLQKAVLFLHPHNGGSGIQNKLIEAMSSGCPVVTTPTGNQGINAEHGKHLLIGKNDSELAENAIKIIQDKDFAAKLSKNARELIVNKLSWQSVFKELDKLIYETLDNN
jgi:glycosyltransferase involved in cell wall biosynthesis